MFVNKFKYLGHVIDNSFSDDSDINEEIKVLFTRTNVLCRRFSRCSLAVKVRLFRTCVSAFMTRHCGLILLLVHLTDFPLAILNVSSVFRIPKV